MIVRIAFKYFNNSRLRPAGGGIKMANTAIARSLLCLRMLKRLGLNSGFGSVFGDECLKRWGLSSPFAKNLHLWHALYYALLAWR